jgi:hypothetical protein
MYSSQSRGHDDVPFVPRPGAEGGSPGGLARDLDARFDHRGVTRPVEPPMRSNRPPKFMNNQVAISRPSTGRRMFRALARFSIAILIGVGATLGWQSHGDKAKEAVSMFAPSLGRLLPDSTSTAPAAVLATSGELVQQLAPIARDLAAVQRSVDQLVAKQEQMDQSIATLRTIEQDLRQKVAPPTPSRAATAQPKPPQPAAQSFSAPPSPPPPPFAGPTLR